MKNLFLLLAVVLWTLSAQAQQNSKQAQQDSKQAQQASKVAYDEQTLRDVLIYNRLAEVTRMVSLTPAQVGAYTSCCVDFYKAMYQAIYVEKDNAKMLQTMYDAKKILADTFWNILTEQQRVTYVRNTYAEETKYRALERLEVLVESDEYTKAELDKAYRDIYEYLMQEKIANMLNRYDIAKQRENIEQVKKTEPQSLKEVKARQKLKTHGKAHERGYR
jgi:hypothetical protein